MKRLSFFIFLISTVLLQAQSKDRYYIKSQVDTLVYKQNGNPIAMLKQFSEIEIIEEDSLWAKVIITGWLKKENLSLIESEPFDAGNNFFYQKLNIYRDHFYGGTMIAGEMVNENEQKYKIASFQITLYDKDGEIIDTSNLFFSDFESNEKLPFSQRFPNVQFNQRNRTEIKYKLGNTK